MLFVLATMTQTVSVIDFFATSCLKSQEPVSILRLVNYSCWPTVHAKRGSTCNMHEMLIAAAPLVLFSHFLHYSPVF